MKCKNCGFNNLKDSTFCQDCGQGLDENVSGEKKPVYQELEDVVFAPKKKSSALKVVLIVLALLVGGFLLLVILNSAQQPSEATNDNNATENSDSETSSEPLPTFNSTYLYLAYYECSIYYDVCNVILPVRGTTNSGAQVELLSPTYSLLAVTPTGEVRGDISITLALGTNTLKFQVTYPDGQQEIKYVDATLETK